MNASSIARGLLFVFVSALGSSPAMAAPADVTYQYDQLGRLRGAAYGGSQDASYAYDSAGNRLSSSVSAAGVVLSIDAPASAAVEGAAVSFPVTRRGVHTLPVTVECLPGNGTAVAGGSAPYDDYDPATKTLIFLPTDPSPSTKACDIASRDDNFHEGPQTLKATLQNPGSGGTISATGASATGTISDNDAPPVFGIAAAAQTEGGLVSLPVSKSGNSEIEHRVTASTSDGTARLDDADYAQKTATLVFTAAVSSQTFSVSTQSDSKYEANETFGVSLSAATNGASIGTASATGTINNDDTAPSFSIDDASPVNEGATAVFTISKSGMTSLSHSVAWSTADSTAVAGSDYEAITGSSLSFGPSESSKTVTVRTLTDPVAESTETFRVNLSSTTGSNGATISDGQGTGTILNVVPTTFSVSDAAAVSEGGIASFTISKTNGDGAAHTIAWSTSNGTATAGSDYLGQSSTAITFSAAETSKVVTVQTLRDTVSEGNETFFVNLTANGDNTIAIADAQGQGTIANTVPATFSVSDAGTVSEGGMASFTISKANSDGLSHTITWATSNGTATAGSDYVGRSSTTITFAAADTAKVVSVQTLRDTASEGSETFFVDLGANGDSSILIGDGQGQATITNVVPTSFSIGDATAVNEGALASFTVSKSNSDGLAHTISWSTANGSATAGSDYVAVTNQSLTFGASESSKSITVQTLADAVSEGSETFVVNLSTNGDTAILLSDGQGTGTITNVANSPPTAVADSRMLRRTNTGGALDLSLTFDPRTNDTDPNGDPLTIISVTQGARGSVFINAGTSVTYDYDAYPGGEWHDTDTFTYTISDGRGGSSTATVTIRIDILTNQ